MKICWDNLEKLKYNKITNKFSIKAGIRTNGKNFYRYYKIKDSCKNCKNEFLAIVGTKAIFCSYSCANSGEFNISKIKEIKEKISKSNKGKKRKKESIEKQKKEFRKNYKTENHSNWKGGYSLKNIPTYNTYAKQLFADECRRNLKDSNILEVKCTYCGKWYIPKNYEITNRIKSINGNCLGECSLYCSQGCKEECPIFGKNKHPEGFKKVISREIQPELRQLVLERDNYKCIKCGNEKNLHCHHIEGIRWNPLESADIDACITVCKSCHIEIHKQPGCTNYDMQCKIENMEIYD